MQQYQGYLFFPLYTLFLVRTWCLHFPQCTLPGFSQRFSCLTPETAQKCEFGDENKLLKGRGHHLFISYTIFFKILFNTLCLCDQKDTVVPKKMVPCVSWRCTLPHANSMRWKYSSEQPVCISQQIDSSLFNSNDGICTVLLCLPHINVSGSSRGSVVKSFFFIDTNFWIQPQTKNICVKFLMKQPMFFPLK